MQYMIECRARSRFLTLIFIRVEDRAGGVIINDNWSTSIMDGHYWRGRQVFCAKTSDNAPPEGVARTIRLHPLEPL